MPVYNEEAILPQIIKEWIPIARSCNGMLIFLNDGGKDKSLELLKEAFQKYENLILIDKENSGHGPTCVMGYKWALDQGFQWIFQTDSDGQTSSDEFIKVWKEKEGNDFIFGYRLKRGDGLNRFFFSKVLMVMIWAIFKIYIKDANVPFRLMESRALKKVIDKIPTDLYLSNAYLSIIIKKYFPIKWAPISFLPRKSGIESVPPWKFFKVGPKVIKEFWACRKNLV